MSTPQRISLKIPSSPEADPDLDLEPFIGLFHRFIQAGSVEGLLIDVADYAHVPAGPGVMLIGHEVDYAIDQMGGQTGLLVTRKRYSGISTADITRDLLRKALIAVEAIQNSENPMRFAIDRAELRVLDRLVLQNDEAGFSALLAEVENPLQKIFGANCRLDRLDRLDRGGAVDHRETLGLRITASRAIDLNSAIEALGGRGELARAGREVEARELKRLRDQGIPHVLLDVREPDEFETCNIGGRLIPLGSLGDHMEEFDKTADIIVHCKGGPRGAQATELLRSAGFERVRNLRGGILAWIDQVDPSLRTY